MAKGYITIKQFDSFMDTLAEAMYDSEFYSNDTAEMLPDNIIIEWAKTWGIQLLAEIGIDKVKVSNYDN